MRSRSAVFELTLLAVVLIAVLLFSFTWLFISREASRQMLDVERALLLVSDALHSSLRHSMMQNRREEIVDTLKRVARETRIERIRMIEHRGRVTLSTHDGDVEQRVDRTAPGCAICHTPGGAMRPAVRALAESRSVLAGGMLRTYTPVLAEPGCINRLCHGQESGTGVLGVIDLSWSLAEMDRARSRSQVELAGLSVLVMASGEDCSGWRCRAGCTDRCAICCGASAA